MQLAFSAASIVALGKFDPDLFKLESLVECRVISAAEASRSKVKAILPAQITHFTLPWGELLVLHDRLHTTATEAPFIRVADLVAQAMNMAGDHCSIRAFGINFEAHFDLGSVAARDALAMKFAPPDAWGEWGRTVRASMNSETFELHGGLAVVTMREQFRAGDIRGWYDVTLSSSDKVPNNTGVRFLTNHHHEYAPELSPAPKLPVADLAERQTTTLLAALETAFDDSIGKAERIFTEVLA
jgi:hypothetical protein